MYRGTFVQGDRTENFNIRNSDAPQATIYAAYRENNCLFYGQMCLEINDQGRELEEFFEFEANW